MNQSFFIYANELDKLKMLKSPKMSDLKSLVSIIHEDNSLKSYFYEKNNFSDVPHSQWLKLLNEAGEFEDLNNDSDEKRMQNWLKSYYLTEAAKDNYADVLAIIKSLNPKSTLIQGRFIEALGNMPEDVITKNIWIIWKFISENKYYEWHFIGEQTAKIMLKIANNNPQTAFEIASLLLYIWKSEEESHYINISSKFRDYDYKNLINTYYSKLWDLFPFDASILLINIFDNYLSDINKNNEYDISSHYYMVAENLEEITLHRENIEIILIQAIRDSLLLLKDKEPEKTDKVLKLLQSKNKVIFNRIEMFLLKHIKGNKYKKRINEIVCNEEYFSKHSYRFEYSLLIKEKFDILENQTKEKFFKLVDSIPINENDFRDWFKKANNRDCTEEDLRQYVNSKKARRLYLLKEIFPKKYEKYKNAGKSTDEKLKPEPSIWGSVRDVPGDENTPAKEEMLQMRIEEAFAFISNPVNYPPNPNKPEFQSPADGLAYTFQMVVKEKVVDYLNANIKDIAHLPKRFIERYFNGIWDAIREKKSMILTGKDFLK